MNYISETIKEFDKEFVTKVHPFLGGQRNYWKTIPDGKRLEEMKQIDEIKSFLQSKLEGLVDEITSKIKLVPFDDDGDYSERARLKEMHQHGYNKAVKEIKQLLKEYK